MKTTFYFRCVDCDHVVRCTSYMYLSPCPKCGGELIQDFTEIRFQNRQGQKRKYRRKGVKAIV